MKLYFHRAVIYVVARMWPSLFLRYFDDYYKRYIVKFLSKMKEFKPDSKCTGAFIKEDKSEKTQPDVVVEKRKRCSCDRERKTCKNCKGWY